MTQKEIKKIQDAYRNAFSNMNIFQFAAKLGRTAEFDEDGYITDSWLREMWERFHDLQCVTAFDSETLSKILSE